MTKPAGILRDKVLVALKRPDRSELHVRFCRHANGVDYIDIRHWEPTWHREKLKPGKGVTLRLEELAAVAEALGTVKPG